MLPAMKYEKTLFDVVLRALAYFLKLGIFMELAPPRNGLSKEDEAVASVVDLARSCWEEAAVVTASVRPKF